MIVAAERLSRTFGDTVALDGLSLEVSAGELVGLLGPNGAGKTTTLAILATLLRPDSGTARICGHDVLAEPHAVRRSLGLVFQGPSLDLQLTARENLVFHARLYGVPRSGCGAAADAALELVELQGRADEPARRLSGGMRRRLEIARALLHEPPLLILDEPTAGLDPHARNRIWEHLHRIRSERKTTILLSTHDMEEAERCQRVAILHRGRLVATGEPEALKGSLGGDILTIEADEPGRLAPLLREAFGRMPQVLDGVLRLECRDGHRFIPQLVERFPGRIRAISVTRPSLGDVFLELTGHAVRDGELLAVAGSEGAAPAGDAGSGLAGGPEPERAGGAGQAVRGGGDARGRS